MITAPDCTNLAIRNVFFTFLIVLPCDKIAWTLDTLYEMQVPISVYNEDFSRVTYRSDCTIDNGGSICGSDGDTHTYSNECL